MGQRTIMCKLSALSIAWPLAPVMPSFCFILWREVTSPVHFNTDPFVLLNASCFLCFQSIDKERASYILWKGLQRCKVCFMTSVAGLAAHLHAAEMGIFHMPRRISVGIWFIIFPHSTLQKHISSFSPLIKASVSANCCGQARLQWGQTLWK